MERKKKQGDKEELISVMIETPKGSQHKYAYDPERHLYSLSHTLPLGYFLPFDFGFIPNTSAPDGDPLDVLVLMDAPTFPGCLVNCRLIGVMTAQQTENKITVENDRLVAVHPQSVLYSSWTSLKAADKKFLKQMEEFFIFSDKQLGKDFKPTGIYDAREAFRIIEKFRKK